MITQQNLVFDVEAVANTNHESTINHISQQTNIIQCRICLENISRLSPHVLTPCKCSGSVKYVHFKCMSQWICRNVQRPIHESTQKDCFQCQMCKQQIIYQTQAQIQCISCKQLKQNISANKLIFFGLLFVSIALFVLLAFCTYIILFSGILNFDGQRWFESILIILSLVLLFSIQLLFTYFFVKKFVFTFKIFIVKIYPNSNVRNRASSLCNSEANLISLRRNTRVVNVEPIIENVQ